jgi:hypothetical protein
MKKLLKTLGILVLTTAHLIAAPSGKMKTPDFLKGDPIPEGATHDWNLGATGARGWIFSSKMVTSEARQIYITKVDARSPAAKVLKVGDVILGVSGKPFSYDPRTEFGKALTIAESNAGKGNLSLICWRQGKQKQLVVKLPVLGTYSATAPYDCPKSSRILKQGCAALAKRMKEDNYGKQSPVTRSLNALALLASGHPTIQPMVWPVGITATLLCYSLSITWRQVINRLCPV